MRTVKQRLEQQGQGQGEQGVLQMQMHLHQALQVEPPSQQCLQLVVVVVEDGSMGYQKGSCLVLACYL